MEKKYKILWMVSGLIISCIALFIVICNIFSLDIPDILIRVLGVIGLLAVPVMVYSLVKFITMKKNGKE